MSGIGKVFLVGAGPGDPDLLTVKALRVLRQADVVLHDSLVSREVLNLVSSMASVIDVGKRCGTKLLSQDEINALLVDYAQKVANVVRLKGGDPMLFGRAGEEIDALREANVPYEIVPGISAAFGAASAAGISLTDRRFASQLLITTGHRGVENLGVDWRRLASADTTLIVYMPGSDLAKIAQLLSDAGFDHRTPCLIVSSATRAEQQILRTTLSHLPNTKPLPAPSVLIVGRVAGTATDFAARQLWQDLLEDGDRQSRPV